MNFKSLFFFFLKLYTKFDIFNEVKSIISILDLKSSFILICYRLSLVFEFCISKVKELYYAGGRRHHDHMIVGFTTTYAISAYHHWYCKFKSRSGRGVQHYVINFVSDLRQVCGFLQVLRFPPPIKLTATI